MSTYIESNRYTLPKVLRTFTLSLAVSLLGFIVGNFVPPALFLPIMILEFVMLIAAFFVRRRKMLSYGFLYAFTFISGITLFPIVTSYLITIGAKPVLMSLAATVAIFGGLSLYASTTKRDFSFLGGFLTAALLALIVIGIFNLFSPLSSTATLVYSFIGILVFSGYVIFDVNRMKQYGVSDEAVPLMALNLYLDFVNLFIYILQFIGVLSSRD
ncbi:membrane protein [Bacillus sp. FJAT-27916]|uniref:Bax inhibitor-1/YccA family protein n=1 Tax=Bacillaceae TaxID=186817 RepID=UPI000670D646|nr:Bax inhibitor-1/YccA family protein [Bacillus sp. FJAT-27916]KMY45183.1 membrane protein [Bacillus sp. FJAT-27916]